MTLKEITLAIANGSSNIINYNTASIHTPNKQIVFKDLIILYIGELRFFYPFPEGKFDLEKYKHWEFLTTNANQKKINNYQQ